ncbi:MAG: M23 family metallopeptidase [Gemmatimonadaceae bacterium]
MHGGDTLNVNHHMAVEAQWYALDFAKVGGATGRALATTSPPECADFYGWGAQVLAPADATVVAADDGWPDNSVGTTDPQHPLGNHIVLQHNDRFYWLAHLQRGSLAVRRADRVDQGGVLALCGNSGNSDFPHVHLHASRSQVFGQGRGENLIFSSIDVELTGARFANVDWPLIRGLFVANHIAGGV